MEKKEEINILKHPDFLKPYKLDNESDNDYKLRQQIGKLYIKHKKKGRLFWLAKEFRDEKGLAYDKTKMKKTIELLKSQNK